MEKKRKIAVAISSHSAPPFTLMTVGSLIRECGDNSDLNIHIGVHSNIDDSTSDFSLFDETRKVAHIHQVDEIDWIAHDNDVYRYSKMHAKNLENILKHIRFYDFEYLLILDNDLLIKRDFITELLEKYPESDLIGHYFLNSREPNTVTEQYAGETVQMMPKCSVWCTLVSRKLFDRIIADTSLIYPEKVSDYQRKVDLTNFYPTVDPNINVVFDTFSKILLIENEGWKFTMLHEDEIIGDTHHFTASSFNYGYRQGGIDRKVESAWEMYRKEFPTGLTELKI